MSMIINLIKEPEANPIKAQENISLMPLLNELNNKDFIAKCPVILRTMLQDLFALNPAKLPSGNSFLRYTDNSLIAIHEHFTAYKIPLRNLEIMKALLLLLAKTNNHPLIFQIYCVYMTDSLFLLQAETRHLSFICTGPNVQKIYK